MSIQDKKTVIEFSRKQRPECTRGSRSSAAPVFYTELKRRNVFRTAAAYVVVAWVIAQVADVLCDGFLAPDWVMRAILIALALGLPISVILSWYVEFSASLKWEPDTEPIGAIVRQKGRTIDIVIITVLTLTVSTLLVWRPEASTLPEMVCSRGQNDARPVANSEKPLSTADVTPDKNTTPN